MEMKKSYSPFGSTPLSVDEVLPDIQTGRAVYPDKDRGADASYMERINQYKHEGFHDVSEGGGSSGGASIPTPTVEDAGKSVVVNDEGQYALTNSGGGGTPLVVNVVAEGFSTTTTLDKTWQEIYDAFPAAYISNSRGDKISITEVFEGKGVYRVRVSANNDVTEYTTDVASGYPSHGEK